MSWVVRVGKEDSFFFYAGELDAGWCEWRVCDRVECVISWEVGEGGADIGKEGAERREEGGRERGKSASARAAIERRQ